MVLPAQTLPSLHDRPLFPISLPPNPCRMWRRWLCSGAPTMVWPRRHATYRRQVSCHCFQLSSRGLHAWWMYPASRVPVLRACCTALTAAVPAGVERRASCLHARLHKPLTPRPSACLPLPCRTGQRAAGPRHASGGLSGAQHVSRAAWLHACMVSLHANKVAWMLLHALLRGSNRWPQLDMPARLGRAACQTL